MQQIGAPKMSEQKVRSKAETQQLIGIYQRRLNDKTRSKAEHEQAAEMLRNLRGEGLEGRLWQLEARVNTLEERMFAIEQSNKPGMRDKVTAKVTEKPPAKAEKPKAEKPPAKPKADELQF